MRFPQFTDSLRASMYQECIAFFANIVQQDRPLTDIIDADYTFVNQELAGFYGIPNVTGKEFRRGRRRPRQSRRHPRHGRLSRQHFAAAAHEPDQARLLGGLPAARHAAAAAAAGRPSDLSHDELNEKGVTIIEQMRLHRSDARCVSCHERMDPLGIALEGFDAIGRARTRMMDGSPVLDRETTVDGTEIKGLTGLKNYLLRDQQRAKVMRNLCVKFTGYALGRALQPSDQPLIERLMADLAAHEWRSSVLVLGVLTSPQFTCRRDEAVATAPNSPEPQ